MTAMISAISTVASSPRFTGLLPGISRMISALILSQSPALWQIYTAGSNLAFIIVAKRWQSHAQRQ